MAAAASSSLWFEKSARSGARRMSGLADLMTKVAKTWSREFATLASTPGEIAFQSSATPVVETVLAVTGPTPVLVSLDTSWDVPILLRFDKRFLTVVVEAMFGSAGDEEAVATAPGPLSPIETGIAEAVASQVAAALTDGFKELGPVSFSFHAILTKPNPAALGKPQAPLMVTTFSLAVLGNTVELDVLFPKPALDLIDADLADFLDSSGPQADPLWSERLEAEVGRAEVTVQAAVESLPLTLGEIANLKPGQVLAFPPGKALDVRLVCETHDLFRCELGQSKGFYTVRIVAPAAAG